MLYSEHTPAAALAPLVKCYWTLCGDSAGASPERILPDGSFDIVFHLGQPFLRDGVPQPPAMLVGEIRRPVVVSPRGIADVFGVRFHLGGAAAFVRVPMSELRDAVLPIDEVLPRSLAERVAESPSTEARIRLMDAFLMARLSMPRHLPATAVAISIIRRRNESRGVAAAIGVTERTLERGFNECVGMSPKKLARLFRFHAVLADPRLDAGYYDDSHLIHDFREFSGTTPSQFRRERNEMNEAFVGNLQYEGGRDA
jgi:AraC-like DNA-binding protein